MNNIIGLGETVLDIIFRQSTPQQAVPGGSTFNSIISLGRTSIPCSMVTFVGDDHVGQLTLDYLQQNGVDTSYVSIVKGMKSHISLAFLDTNNDAHYTFYKDHAAVTLNTATPTLTPSDTLLFGSYFAINPAIRPTVATILSQAHNATATIYYDINFRQPHATERTTLLPTIQQNMQLSTIVRGSADDFQILYGTRNPNDIYTHHIAPHCPYFICTAGPDTIHLFTPTHHAEYPVPPIHTISTIGAGDNFNAGFLYALHHMHTTIPQLTPSDWQQLITMGQRFAADVCTQLTNSISPHLLATL